MDKAYKIGPIALGQAPRLVAILEQAHTVKFLLSLQSRGASILEIRIDSFPSEQEGLYYLQMLSETRSIQECFGLLATYRENKTNQGRRMAIFEKAAVLADALDIEYECRERQDLIRLARQAGCLSILSTHNFEKTPSDTKLKAVVEEAERLGAELSKIAVFAQSRKDLARLLLFTERYQRHGLITIAMGPHGTFSRLAAPFFGSLLSYGFVTQANAPGQLSLDELHEAFLKFHPDYAGDSPMAAL